MQDFLAGLAFFLIIEGLVYALVPRFLIEIAKLLPAVPERQLRAFGLAAMALGVASVWLLRG
ncbi:DUF2065 domain-containing protein [Rhizobium mesosinicum]|uniref:DUF2065 domain-containing protein n=1 Tax=Rhizobium mesosinicum TaxID=335017 RepID=A0ABS7GZA4_9HYPH|nr:DUF2065 domain-containing protein [Rhizobium mesosinicum]MBW9055324.1 DUF2065 domain-containing protein [Rhizobium mesosinicum]